MNKHDPKFSERANEFAKTWLRGQTCYHHKQSIFWESEDGGHIILKHHGHTEWCGYSKNQWCETCYILFKLDGEAPQYFEYREPELKVWEGRWLKKYWADVEALGVCSE